MHQATFGDHTDDTVVLLASTSKVPAVMTLMALQEDANVDFSMSEPVSTYLAYDGPYADRTVEQMVSNTSGIPGLRLLWDTGLRQDLQRKTSIISVNSAPNPSLTLRNVVKLSCKMSYPHHNRRAACMTTAAASGKSQV